MTKALKKAMMNRTRLDNIANKTKQPKDRDRYKAERNVVVKLNRNEKEISLPTSTLSPLEKLFGKHSSPFSQKSLAMAAKK